MRPLQHLFTAACCKIVFSNKGKSQAKGRGKDSRKMQLARRVRNSSYSTPPLFRLARSPSPRSSPESVSQSVNFRLPPFVKHFVEGKEGRVSVADEFQVACRHSACGSTSLPSLDSNSQQHMYTFFPIRAGPLYSSLVSRNRLKTRNLIDLNKRKPIRRIVHFLCTAIH